MNHHTAIEWTHIPGYRGETWNPTAGCDKLSAGCKFCYAEVLHTRRHKAYRAGKLQNMPQYAEPFTTVRTMGHLLDRPLRWREPRAVFVDSMGDLFHQEVPLDVVRWVLSVAASCPDHLFLILTKRTERMADITSKLRWGHGLLPFELNGRAHLLHTFCSTDSQAIEHPNPVGWWPRNIWLGTSVEDQATADERIPHLLRTPAAVRFLSCEPLLGLIDLERPAPHDCRQHGRNICPPWYSQSIDWVIAGGESGPKARPMHPDWARGLRDQCRAAGVPFFFKQWGEWLPYNQCSTEEQRKAVSRTTIESNTTGNGKQTYFGKTFWRHPDGQLVTGATSGIAPVQINLVGKKIAGRVLDGRTWDEFPPVPVQAEVATYKRVEV